MIIDSAIPEILDHLRAGRNVVLEAPPGAGKTTRVPPALLALGGEVLVLEPRRLAARWAARRVASELGEKVGETVGYQVRFEEVAGPRTRLRFLTEGVLTRKLISDYSGLRNVSAVVLDEFHERHLEGDLALALLLRLQRTARPDLRLVVMSATMEAAPVARLLGGAPAVCVEGKRFPLEISYRPHSPAPLEEQVAAAAADLAAEGDAGDILVFLPGAAEIRRAARACQALAEREGLLITPLHGELASEEQDRAVLPAARPKLILSTNVAESSITIEGVTAVIDTGLARVAADNPWSGLATLNVARISKASATQRAGRAGRVRAGRVIRLYPAEDYQRRPEQETPEILRRELSQMLLSLAAIGIRHPGELPWLDAPPEAAVAAAQELLERLGAWTRIEDMVRYPLHPRLARLAIEAEARGAREEGLALAALLSTGARLPDSPAHVGPSDLFALIESEWDPRARRVLEQLRRVGARGRSERAVGEARDRALLIAALTAFPDRVAKRRQGEELLLASGGAARLSPSSVVQRAPLLIAVDIEERREHGVPLVRMASAIEPEWLLDLFPERLRERRAMEWNRTAERVDAVDALLYDGVVIEQTRSGRVDEEEAARILAGRALEAGAARFADMEEIERYLARLRFAAAHSNLPALSDGDVAEALASLCRGLRSFSELEAEARGGGLLRALEKRLPPGSARLLEEVAPLRVRLPSGRQTVVHYPPGETPWIASRLQDFFGLRDTPRVARGAVPVVVHLLAPNQRPVQMTTDLAGFWERLYPKVRRELCRRYPRHAWPLDPTIG